MSVSFSSPKSQGGFPRREASEEEGKDRQLRRERQVPDLAVSFPSCFQQDSGQAREGRGWTTTWARGEEADRAGEVLEKTRG